jgi:hypothetical protein
MKKQLSRLFAVGCLAFVGQLFLVQSAFAHHADLSGQFICGPDKLYLEYTASAWETDDPASRENPQVEIYADGILVQTGAFAAPDYSFTGMVPVPESAAVGDMIALQAVVVGTWGNGTGGGESTSEFFFVPEQDCGTEGTGRFTGGGNVVIPGGYKLTKGFTIHCDLLLSNNLQINWRKGKGNFHLGEHLTTVECSDDPAITQAPPDAPVDTIVGTGIGRYNGADGYSITFTLRDFGEPGKEDQAGFLIFETANPGNVVLDVPVQTIRRGNIQAHFDQPHK